MNNLTLAERDKQYIWHPFTPQTLAPPPLPVKSAKGSKIILEDGTEIIDAISSWWVNIHGHGNEELAETIKQQVLNLDHIIFAGFTHEPAVQLAEKLMPLLPGEFSKVFFSDNGSTSTEIAIKMVIQYFYNIGETKRKKVIAIKGSYHGDTFGALSMADRNPFSAPFDDYLFDVDFIPFPTEENWEEVKTQMQSLCETEEVCGFIFEPLVQGASGMRMYKSEWLDDLIGIAQKYGTLCIADEVMTGFYRTGKLFATNHLTKNSPDIICMSKALTAGLMPLSLTICTEKIYSAYLDDDRLKTFFHGHSFTGNPIACALAVKSLEMLLSNERQGQITNIINRHTEFGEKVKKTKFCKSVRQQGTILAIEYDTEKETSYFNSIRDELYDIFLKRNLLLRPLGNTVYINTTYVISNSELDEIYDGLFDVFEIGIVTYKTNNLVSTI
ncbi:adenosylmethionine--8-amino-7-oxononanoate transaminase [Flammeovirga pectinis]|uniref:Adenosylmethionine-8-amino-7-oxononanoate aminotransferase n=1 Tax=Flammeovirga pectinis TaxID=2494373 RepID=A0A3Q9FPL4_9BACT|nr:adenosylmethionine--8-amino-7-oxononanoate transaminase [Flammeovirga pectinis]AZQ62438.1 adenosylmethionine--8-amino-7-oxononanoate transaminase [Flammeovirga pectinis]